MSRPITESDPLLTRIAVARSDNGNAFAMFLQVFADGTVINAEVALGAQYFGFLNNLLFDANGNSRLYEKVIVDGSSGKTCPKCFFFDEKKMTFLII